MRQDAVDILLVFGNEQHRTAVAHLVFDLLGRGGRIDAVDDGAERLGGLVADQPLLAGVGHDGDAVTGADTLGRKGLGGAGHQLGVLPPRPFAIDAALFGTEGNSIGLRARQFQQQRRRRGAAQVVGGAQCVGGFTHHDRCL